MLELKLITHDGKAASGMFASCSSIVALSAIKAEIAHMISDDQDVEELCDVLCDNILYGAEEDGIWCPEDTPDEARITSKTIQHLRDVARKHGFAFPKHVRHYLPEAISHFKEECRKNGVTTCNIRYVVFRYGIKGYGGSAIYMLYDELRQFRKRYAAGGEEQKEAVLQELVAFMQTEPELEIHDNEVDICGKHRIHMTGSLEKRLKEYLSAKRLRGNAWVGEWVVEDTYDVFKDDITVKEALYI